MKYIRYTSAIIACAWVCLGSATAQKLSWEKTSAAGGGMIPSMIATQSGIIIAGVYQKGIIRSADRGLTWSAANSGLTNLSVSSVAAGDGNTVFAATDGGGVFRSSDNGQTWSPMNEGLASLSVESLASAPGGMLVAGTGRGVFIFNGMAWEATAMTKQASTIALGANSAIMAATPTQGSFRSTDFGATWKVMSGLTAPGILAIISVTDNFVLAASSGLYGSTDGGETWKPTSFSANIIMSIAVTPSGWILVGTDEGIMGSTDQGRTWMPAGTGLAGWVTSILSGPDGVIYAGTSSGQVYRGTLGNSSARQWSGENESEKKFSLRHFPNPAQEKLEVIFTVPTTDNIQIALYDLDGRQMQQLISGRMERGEHHLSQPLNVPSGNYLLQIQQNGTTEHRLVTVVR